MIRTLVCLHAAMAILVPTAVSAQSSSAPEDSAAAAASETRGSRIYYGGSISFDIGSDYTRISLTPHLGYKLSSKVSLGTKVRYEYLNDRRGPFNHDSHNYGGSVFSRYRFIPALYGHAEYSYMSYGYNNGRWGVPFLLVGAGYSHPMGDYASFYAEVLFDLINDENSPYDSGSPRLSFGISMGF